MIWLILVSLFLTIASWAVIWWDTKSKDSMFGIHTKGQLLELYALTILPSIQVIILVIYVWAKYKPKIFSWPIIQKISKYLDEPV